MTIEYLSLFVSWVDSFNDPLASSSSSFVTTSFLIQMLRWIRGSSRIESFIFLIAWRIFFGSWELDLQLLPSSLSLIMSQASSCVQSSQSLQKVIKFLMAHIPWMNESDDLGRPFRVVTTISSSSSIASSQHQTLPLVSSGS